MENDKVIAEDTPEKQSRQQERAERWKREHLEREARDAALEAAVENFVSAGGIQSTADYDRFAALIEGSFDMEWMFPLGSISLMRAERLYCRLTGIDPMSLPLPKWEREYNEITDGESDLELAKAFEQTRGKNPAIYPKDYIYGLYPRGAVSILHGPSGVGKTRLLLEQESAARDGREYLSSTKGPKSILFILRDRLREDYHETLDSMGLPRDFVPLVELPEADFDNQAIASITRLIEAHHRPELVVVEGLDQTMTSLVNRRVLVPMLKNLQMIAKHCGCALVGTWGAPKRQSNPRDMYANSRDAATGGADLARMCSSMVGMGFEFKKARQGEMNRLKTGRMYLNIDLRAKHGRQAMLRFNDAGRIVEDRGIEVHIDDLPEESYAEAQRKAQEVLGMSRTTFWRHQKGEK